MKNPLSPQDLIGNTRPQAVIALASEDPATQADCDTHPSSLAGDLSLAEAFFVFFSLRPFGVLGALTLGVPVSHGASSPSSRQFPEASRAASIGRHAEAPSGPGSATWFCPCKADQR